MADTKPKTLYNMHEAKTQLSRLVERALAGEEIVIGRAGKALVSLRPVDAPPARRVPGRYAGKIWVSEDFDAPLPEDILRAFEGKEDEEFDS